VKVGDTYSGRREVFDADGDPGAATVTITVLQPDGTIAPATPVQTSTGVYDFDFTTTQTGLHTVVTSATGGVLGSNTRSWPDDVFHADDTTTAVRLVGLAEAKQHLNMTRTDADEELLEFIGRASAAVESHSKLWHRATIVETLDRYPRRAIVLSKRRAVSVSSVVENGVTIDPLTYQLAGQVLTRGYYSLAANWLAGPGALVVTYQAGETVVPLDVRQAVLLMLEHLWQTQRGPSSGRTSSAAGQEAAYDPRQSFSLPRRVQELLEPYTLGVAVA
jgi:hypothetical protein